MLSVAMIDQIIRLQKDGKPIRKIALILGVSRNTVRRYLRIESEDPDIKTPSPPTKAEALDGPLGVDWKAVLSEKRKGASSKILYEEHEPPMSYSYFCRQIRRLLRSTPSAAIRLDHVPGERAYVDFCDGLYLTDAKTGKRHKTHLFVGTLPFSSYTFAVFVHSQKLADFIACHQKMWAFFGGVTPYVVVDNLKSGVSKAHKFDPDVNPTYCDYGNSSGFAVLPARPYTPRDKANVESNIGAVQKDFYQKYRNESFYSLAELNAVMHRWLPSFNQRVMKDYGVSRLERFSKEQNLLLPVKGSDYQLAEWKTVKVHPDCCIQFRKSFYSVPYRYVGQSLKVKAQGSTLEIFDGDASLLTCHSLATSLHSRVCKESHFPPTKTQSTSFDIKRCIAKSVAVGPKTHEVVNTLLSGDRPLRYLRRVQGIIRLLDRNINPESLEYASSQALTYRKFTLNFITHCAQQHQATGGRVIQSAPRRDLKTVRLHGGSNHV